MAIAERTTEEEAGLPELPGRTVSRAAQELAAQHFAAYVTDTLRISMWIPLEDESGHVYTAQVTEITDQAPYEEEARHPDQYHRMIEREHGRLDTPRYRIEILSTSQKERRGVLFVSEDGHDAWFADRHYHADLFSREPLPSDTGTDRGAVGKVAHGERLQRFAALLASPVSPPPRWA